MGYFRGGRLFAIRNDPGFESPTTFLLKGEQEELQKKQRAEEQKQKDLVQRTLRQAAIEGEVEIAAEILGEYPGAVAWTSASGTTALHEACHYGHVELVELLLEKGADVNQLDVWGSNTLHFAAGGGWEEICRMLVEVGGSGAGRKYAGCWWR